MQQGVQTDGTRNIQQCWELLANNVASVCTGLKKNNNPLHQQAVCLIFGLQRRKRGKAFFCSRLSSLIRLIWVIQNYHEGYQLHLAGKMFPNLQATSAYSRSMRIPRDSHVTVSPSLNGLSLKDQSNEHRRHQIQDFRGFVVTFIHFQKALNREIRAYIYLVPSRAYQIALIVKSQLINSTLFQHVAGIDQRGPIVGSLKTKIRTFHGACVEAINSREDSSRCKGDRGENTPLPVAPSRSRLVWVERERYIQK